MKLFSSIFCLLYWVVACPLAYAFETNQLPQIPSHSSCTIYYIHDIHGQLDAQAHIGALIRELSSKNKIGFVALEGYEGSLDLKPIREYPNRNVIRAVVNFLFEQKKISGPVREAALSERALPPLYGIEHSRSYTAHLEAYKNAASMVGQTKTLIAKSYSNLQKLEPVLLNPGLQAFHEDVVSYQNGKTSLRAHLHRLSTVVPQATPNIRLYQEALALETRFVLSQVKSEQSLLLTKLAHQVNPAETRELARSAAALKDGQLTTADFYRRIAHLCGQRNISLETYPNLNNYMAYSEKIGRIDFQKMPQDLEQLEAEAYRKMIRTAGENRLIEQERFLSACNKLIDFSMTPADLTGYKKLKLQYVNLAPSSISFFERFYDIAEQRDAVLAENIIKTVAATHSHSGIVVAGGFHFEGIRHYLAEHQIETVSKIPALSSVDASITPSDYLGQVSPGQSLIEQVLNGAVWTLAAPPAQDVAFIPVMSVALMSAVSTKPMDARAQLTQLGGDRTGLSITSAHTGVNTGIANLDTFSGRLDIQVQAADSGTVGELKIERAQATWRPRQGIIESARFRVGQWQEWLNVVGTQINHFLFSVFTVVPVTLLRRWGLATSCLLVSLICACAGPEHARQDLPYTLNREWWAATDPKGNVQNGWLLAFHDPLLENFIDLSLRDNPDIKIAEIVTASRHLLTQAQADLLPALGVGATAASTGGFQAGNKVTSVLGGFFEVAWEPLGFLMGAGKRKEAAEADVQAAEAFYEGARQSLAAEVSRGYVILSFAKQQAEIAHRQVENNRAILKLVEDKMRYGTAVESDLHLATADLAAAQQREKNLQSVQDRAARALEVLLGTYPSSKIKFMVGDVLLPPEMPIGVPSDILNRRLDIQYRVAKARSAGLLLDAAWFDRYFPRFALTAAATETTSNPPGFKFNTDNAAWAVAGNLTAPIWDAGALAAAQGLRAEDEITAVQELLKAKTNAFREVEDALGDSHYLEEQQGYQETVVAEKKAAFENLKQRYEAGLESLFQVLDLQRQIDVAELELTAIKEARLITWINLYKALGGSPFPDKTPAASSGGSWSTNPDYIATAWRETLISFAIVFALFIGQTVQHALSSGALSGPTLNASFWFIAPVFFYFAHVFKNPMGLKDINVQKLTAAKFAVSAVGYLLLTTQIHLGFTFPVMAGLIFITTLWHKAIQDQVVALAKTGALTSAFINPQLVLNEIQRGRFSNNPIATQSLLQSMAAHSKRLNQTAAVENADLSKPALQIVVLDSGFEGDPEGVVKTVLALQSARSNQATLFVTDTPELEAQVRTWAGSKAAVVSAPSVFDYLGSDTPRALSLVLLESFLSYQGYFSRSPELNVVGREGLTMLMDGLSVDSVFRKSVFTLITKELSIVPLSFSNLSELAALARVIAQQA